MHKYLLYFIFSFLLFFSDSTCIQAQQPSISMQTALTNAYKRNPGLRAYEFRVQASRGTLRQSGLKPNPEFSIEFEKFGGNKEFAGTGLIEQSISLGQEFQTAGKLGKKVKASQVELKIAQEEFEFAKLNLANRVCKAFYGISSLQKLIVVQKEFVKLSQENADAVAKKVEAGETPKIDLTRAQVEASSARTELGKMLRNLETLRYELSSLWAETSADFSIDDQNLNVCSCYTKLDLEDEALTLNHPKAKIASLKHQLAKAENSLAKAESTPNFKLEGGVVRERASNKHNYFIGLSMPLTIFDNNRGNRESAAALTKHAENELAQVAISRKASLIELQRQLYSLNEEIENVHNSLLPGAETAYTQIKTAYEEGERELFELFDARRVMLEAQKAAIEIENDRLNVQLEFCLLTGCPEFFGHYLPTMESYDESKK